MEAFLNAVRDVVKDVGAAELAEKMGLSHVSLLQRANPDNDAHKLTANQLFQVLLFSQDMRPLEVLAARFGYQLVATEKPAPQNVNTALMGLTAETAELTLAVVRGMEDGRLDSLERKQIKREIGHVRKQLDAMEASVDAQAGAA